MHQYARFGTFAGSVTLPHSGARAERLPPHDEVDYEDFRGSKRPTNIVYEIVGPTHNEVDSEAAVVGASKWFRPESCSSTPLTTRQPSLGRRLWIRSSHISFG